ncbi:type II toxin-antitoxin system tRNA(fMet)-specific endonuclease VapC [Phormidium tenue]|uniref:Ribonuclease VapC n=1 Tax=Phormidium tenue FACHB-1050 TaxID=2692857 RepID=A0ABR8CDF9_9CYAN|nr:type II toxin-antitoxin system VapC family toxin [Phormidium tenue]MBD2317747.1 type II toxin-antitoxin system VapC family toxin [Phormidium tenue FACHB-1050]
MIYLLDTNTCIGYINRRNPAIYQHFLATSPDDVCICDVVKFELYYGAYKGSRTAENLENLSHFFADLTSLPFDGKAALICGQIRAKLQKMGTPIGSYDLQIAAIALANNLILVTHNTREFERVEGLKLEDWQE